MKHLICCAVCCAVVVLGSARPLRAEAQTSPLAFDPAPKAGDCKLTISLPSGVNPDSAVITLDSDQAPLAFTVTERAPLVAALKAPLVGNSDVTITIGSASAKARVAAAPVGTRPPLTCLGAADTPSAVDEREVFESSGFLGEVFDNFAPNVNGAYANPAGATDQHSRLTAGVEAQYRLVGKKNAVKQLWIAGYVLHGMRTADASCADTQTNADCLHQEAAHPATSFSYILGHASTIEAHVDARLELFRIQGDTDVPAKVYVFGRAGFLDLENAPHVYDSDAVGMGIIAPKGAFRNSYAQVGWGVSKQYDTDRAFDRFKINGVLVFDVLPTLSADSILTRLGAGSRFFLAISIDRNFRNGPDAVQTYIGADFDLRRVFGGF
jgi:hypothetical protein